MPQNASVDKILSDAKNELNKANTMSKSLPTTPAPKAAAVAPAATKPAAPKPTLKNELDAKGEMVSQAKKALEGTGVPKMHRGGTVKADGIYQLQKGEHVLTAPEAQMAHKHALMAAGIGSMARAYKAGDSQSAAPAKAAAKSASTKGQPVKMDRAHKKPEKKETGDIKVRPEKHQAAQVKQQMER